MQQIADWLNKLGLSEYAQCFAENGIDIDVLLELTDQDLEKLGVLLGHRRRMLRAIRELALPSTTATAPIQTKTGLGPESGAERRQITVVFTDLVGSTALSTRLDAEDLRSVIGAYHKCVAETVTHFGGFVARYMGDGVLVYFGYPQAHEDDSERAVLAGLALINAVHNLRVGEPLEVRVGAATGSVVVGDLVGSGEAQQRSVVGETPNLAARLQAIAAPNTIVIDESTHRLTGRLFEYEDLGLQDLKGFAKPLRAWRAVGPSVVESRFEALHSADLPLVGRQEEFELLLRRWNQAKSGEGRVVLLSGEAGIGKSRLVAALVAQLQVESFPRLRYSCSPQHEGSALYPVISQLTHAAGIAHGDSDDQKLDKLHSLLAPTTKDPVDVALIAELLSISIKDRYLPLELSPQSRKLRTFAALRAQIGELSSRQPLLIVFEDIHWIDPTSLELIELCVDAAEYQKVLVVMTSRPGAAPTWIDRPHVTHMPLNRLPRSHASVMIKGIARSASLSPVLIEQILERADGVPLFIEELTKAVIESGETATVSSVAQSIPSTLQASLMARLDRLSPIREVAQIGAAIGREFSFELLRAVYRFSEDQLKEALLQLITAELIYRRSDRTNESYKFKHALVQDAAYGTMLRDQRKDLHERIAKALEQHFPERVSAEPEVLAYHFSQAGLVQPAIKYWQLAGQRATERAGSVEAVAYFDKALALLQTIPETAERNQQELSLLVGRGVPLTAIGSYAAPAVGDNYRRAHTLCKSMGTAPQIFHVLQGLYRFYLVSAELQTALETTTQLLDIGMKSQDRGLLMEAHQAHAFSFGFQGELQAAQEHFEACMAQFDPERFQGRKYLYSTDTATSALCLGALIAWLTGYPDRSAAITEQALERARHVDHSYTLAWALSFAAVLCQLRGDVEMTRSLANECMSLCQQREFPFWLASSRIMHGWSLAADGNQVAIGATEMRDGLAAWRKTGARLYAPYFTCCLAEGYLAAHQPADGLAPLAEVVAIVERTGETWWQPELYRLTGELLSAAGQLDEDGAHPEHFFQQALKIATHQGARSLVLRATMSLCRLGARQGLHRKEAHANLATVFNSFDEGFATGDLRAARKMLDEFV